MGEHSVEIRAWTAAGLSFLGIEIDARLNAAVAGDAEVSASGAGARAVVIRAREDLEIASEVRTLLAGAVDVH